MGLKATSICFDMLCFLAHLGPRPVLEHTIATQRNDYATGEEHAACSSSRELRPSLSSSRAYTPGAERCCRPCNAPMPKPYRASSPQQTLGKENATTEVCCQSGVRLRPHRCPAQHSFRRTFIGEARWCYLRVKTLWRCSQQKSSTGLLCRLFRHRGGFEFCTELWEGG